MYEDIILANYKAIYRHWALTHCQDRKNLQYKCQKLRLMPRYMPQYLSLLGISMSSYTIPFEEDCDD